MGEPLTWLGEVLEQADVRVKATKGWKQRAADGEEPDPQGVLEHHTATRATEDDPAPTLEMSIKGRSDLAGPLCNGLIGYDGTVHLIAAGRANHAGKAKKSGPVPAGAGNTLYVGFEWDYDGVHEPSKKQYQAAVKATAAVLNKLGKSAKAARGHKETSVEGKIDPGKVDMDEFREDVAAAMKKLDGGGKDADEDRGSGGRSHEDGAQRRGGSQHGGKSRHDGDSRAEKHRKHLPKPGKGPKPRSKMGPPDPAVYRTIYLVGKDMDVPGKVMLAAFETGLVESHMSNLNWGDADSVGVFQQRPSQGWGGGKAANCMNVNHASREFFEHAVSAYKQDRDISAGDLAQKVQRSGYPGRYDEEKERAQKYLAKTEKHYDADDHSGDEHDGHDKENSGRARAADAAERGESGRRPGKGHGEGEQEQEERGAERTARAEGASEERGESGRRPGNGHGEEEQDDARDRKRKVVRSFSSWVVPGGDDSLTAFARSSDGDLVTAWQVEPKDDWVGWLGLGGDSEGLPVAARGRGGAVSVFALRSDGQVETRTRKGTAKWSKWLTISGKMASRPTALLLRNGALMLFAIGEGGKLHTATQAGPGGRWGRWHPVGGKLKGQPTVVSRPDGTTAVFALNQDDEVCTASQRKAGAEWSKWTVLGGNMASAPFAAAMPDGGLLLIAVGKNGHLYTTTRIEQDTDWQPTGADLEGMPSVATDADGRVSVFARDEDDAVWVAQRSEDGDWSDWTRIKGRVAGDPVSATDEDGAMHVFAIGRNGDMYTTSRDEDSKDWHRWQRLVDSLTPSGKSAHDDEDDDGARHGDRHHGDREHGDRRHDDAREHDGRRQHRDDDRADGNRKSEDHDRLNAATSDDEAASDDEAKSRAE